MDTEATTTPFSRGISQPRDHTTHRRVYLDTYAKRRAGVSSASNTTPVIATTSQSTAAQAQPVVQKPTIVAIPVIQPIQDIQETYIQPQPAVDTFTYTPVRSVAALAIDVVQPQSTQRSYLDTLTRRHQQAVAQAPAAEETIIQPSLSVETQTLFADPANQAKLEANLRALYSDSLTDMISHDPKSASAAHIRTIIATAFACGFMAVGIFTFMGRYSAQPVVAQPIGSPVIEVESSAQAPKEAPAVNSVNGIVAADPEHPVRVVISSIGVNAPVDGLGTTPEGLIAVPKAYGVVGWYNKGSVPGKPGPAVLVGHYAGGNGAVFDNLGNLNNGDLITTTNGKGQSFTYRVTAKNEYNKDQVPMAQIFKSSKESRLEIITCAGKWQAKTYNNRLVITAELVK